MHRSLERQKTKIGRSSLVGGAVIVCAEEMRCELLSSIGGRSSQNSCSFRSVRGRGKRLIVGASEFWSVRVNLRQCGVPRDKFCEFSWDASFSSRRKCPRVCMDL